jgi:hypothetical protein
MKLISCHDGKLLALDANARGGPLTAGDLTADADARAGKTFRTGLDALDALAPGGAFARGAVHELLAEPGDAPPLFVAALLARAAGTRGASSPGPRSTPARPSLTSTTSATATATATRSTTTGTGSASDSAPAAGPDLAGGFAGALVWSDPERELYPPALAALGVPVERLFLLHPADDAERAWAVAECLRCRGVAAVVAAVPTSQRLSRVQARRLQLAAERGGGVGLLLRPAGRASAEHAAATRWLVGPAPGERNVQRWRIQLVFGHGGRVGEAVILEHHRDTAAAAAPFLPRTAGAGAAGGQHDADVVRPVAAHPVHPAAQLADRPAPPGAPTAATARPRRATG